MKKFYLILVAVLTGMALSSCTSSHSAPKGAKPSVAGRTVIELSEAERYAYDAPKGVLRAVGESTGPEQGWATREATAMARANLAEQISSKIISGIEMYRNSYNKTAITKEEVKTVKDSEGNDNQSILQVCEQSLAGARPVKISSFMLPNGTFQIFVCVEADADSVSKYISESQEVEQLVNDNDRVKIEFNRDQFRQRINEALAR